VRKGAAFEGGFALDENENEDENDAEEEMLDAEAITAFALSPNNKEMIAVTRSHLVRKYNLAAPADDGAYDETEKKQSKKNASEGAAEKPKSQSVTSIKDPAKVAFTFGKSGHKLPVTKVAFHPSGIFFATGSVDGLVKIWDTRNGYATHALHPTSDASGGGRGTYAVSCIQWRQTSASLILAIGREDGSIAIHDLLLNAQDTKTASMPVAVLRDHISAVTCVAWLSDGGGGGGSTTSSGLRKHGTGVFFSSGRLSDQHVVNF
jgi:WD40 repeat protein